MHEPDVIAPHLPRSGAPGSLRTRFLNTPLAGRVVAKTGSIHRVNTLSGYVERPAGGSVGRVAFSIQANSHTVRTREMLAQLDSIVGTRIVREWR